MQERAVFNPTGYMIAALVIVANAAAIASEALDPEIESNGVVGFVLFGAGTAALTYVMAGLLRVPAGALWAFVRRPRGGLPSLVPAWAMLAAALALVPASVGANVFKNHNGGVEEFLNAVFFFSFAAIILSFGVLVLATAAVWATQESARLLEADGHEQVR